MATMFTKDTLKIPEKKPYLLGEYPDGEKVEITSGTGDYRSAGFIRVHRLNIESHDYYVIWELTDVTLTPFEFQQLVALKFLGFHWIVRCSSNLIWAFQSMPIKKGLTWERASSKQFVELFSTGYNFITIKDKYPFNIKDLIKDYKKAVVSDGK